MNNMLFLFEENGCKIFKLTVLNHSYFIIMHNGKSFIRKSLGCTRKLVSVLGGYLEKS